MPNLLTLSQDEIDRFNLKGKQVGDTITDEEYSKYQKEYEANRDKESSEDETEDTAPKPAKKK